MDQFTNSSSRKPRLNKHRRAPNRKEQSSNQTSIESVEARMGSWNPFVPEQGASAFGIGAAKFHAGTFVFGKNGGLGGETSSLDANSNTNGMSSDVNSNANNLSRESLGSDEGLVFSKIMAEIKKLDLRDLKSEKKSENIDPGLFKKLPDEMRKMNLKSSDVNDISKSKEGENSLNLINLVYGESEKVTDRHASFGSKGSRNSSSGVSVDGFKTKFKNGLNRNSSICSDESLLSELPDGLRKLNLKNDIVNNKEGLSRTKPINVVSGASEKPTTEDACFGSKKSSKACSGVFEFGSKTNSKACSGVFEFGSKTNSKEGLNGNSSVGLDESLLSKLPDELSKMNLKNNTNVSDFKAHKQTKDVFSFESGTNSSKPINNMPASFDSARSGFSDSNVFIFGSGVNNSANSGGESSINLDDKLFTQLPDDLSKLNLKSTYKTSDFDKNNKAENTCVFEDSMNNAKQTNVAPEKSTLLSASLGSECIGNFNSGVFVFGSGVDSSTNLSRNSSIRSNKSFFSNPPNGMRNTNLTGNVDDVEKKRQDEHVFVYGSSTTSSNSVGSIAIPNSKGSVNSDSANFVFGSGIKKNVGSSQTSSFALNEVLFSKVSDEMKKMNFNSGDNIENSNSGANDFVFGGNKNTAWFFPTSGGNEVPKETAKSTVGIDRSAQNMKNGNTGSLRGEFEFGVKNDTGTNKNDKINGSVAFAFGASSVNPLNNNMENLNSTGYFPNKFDVGSVPSSPIFSSSSEPPIIDFITPLTKETLFPETQQSKSFSTKKSDAKKTNRKKKKDISRQSVPIFQNDSMKFTPERSEVEVKTDVDSNGDFSPMDCSPYHENVSTDQYLRETSVASEDVELNSGSCNEREEMLVSEAQKLNISADSASVDDQVKKENMGLCNESKTSSERPTSEDIGGSSFIFTASTSNQIPVPATKPNTRRKDRVKASHNLSSFSSGSRATFRTQPDLIPRTGTSVFDSVGKTTTSLPTQNKDESEKGKSQECDATQETSNSNDCSVAAKVLCEKWRFRGNQAYSNGHLTKAEECYTRGVKSIPSKEMPSSCIQPLTLCYSNRAATRMLLGKIREALRDCKMAVSMDPNFLKARVRAANCHLALGEVEEALKQFKNCLQTEKNNSSDQKYLDEASAGLEKAQLVADLIGQSAELLLKRTSIDASKALNMICEALSLSPRSESLLKMKAEALLMMRNYSEVIELCEGTLDLAEKNFGSPSEKFCSSAKLWRSCMIAKSYFHLGKLEEALELLQKNEKSMPAADKTSELASSFVITIRELLRLKSAGNEAFQAARHSEAVEYYTSALACNAESRPFTAVCFCNRAAAFQALGQITDAIADCSLAIALDASYAKAISRRATLHEMIRDYGQAANDLNRLISLLQKQIKEMDKESRAEKSSSIYTELKRARARLVTIEEKSRTEISLDMYMILGVEQSSSAVDIKKAYRKAALRHHPDKAGQSLVRSEYTDDEVWKEVVAEVHADADRLFKMIGEAYTTLSDPSKRQQYDEEEEMRTRPVRGYNASSPKYSSDAYSNYYNDKSFRRQWRTHGNAYQRW